MNNKNPDCTVLDKLSKSIDELRDTLNEMCSTLDASEENNERIIVSRCLDELIVEYMMEINKQMVTIKTLKKI